MSKKPTPCQKNEKGKEFDFEDFRGQLLQMKNMGGMAGLMDKLPGMVSTRRSQSQSQ